MSPIAAMRTVLDMGAGRGGWLERSLALLLLIEFGQRSLQQPFRPGSMQEGTPNDDLHAPLALGGERRRAPRRPIADQLAPPDAEAVYRRVLEALRDGRVDCLVGGA